MKGKKVLYIKSMKFSKDKNGETLVPRSLKERYDHIFGSTEKEEKDVKKVLQNLMSAVDVKNFGATYAESGNNISITGAVQIGQGFNVYEDSEAQEQQILSPFRDASEKKKRKRRGKNSTLGTKLSVMKPIIFILFYQSNGI